MGLYRSKTLQKDGLFSRGETYAQFETIKGVNDSVVTDPSGTSFTLTDPCGVVLVDEQALVRDSAGNYHYYYQIPNTALYGRYETITAVSDTSGNVTKWTKDFYILPWDILPDIRRFSGIMTKKSMSDNVMAAMAYEAYSEALDEVYEYISNEAPNSNPDTGAYVDGTNTVFATKSGRIADKDGDGTVRGYGEVSCGTDIDGYWKDVDGDCHRLNVTVNDARCGKITITQLDGTAIPSDYKWIRLNYYIEYKSYNQRLFRFAVAYLAAYKCLEACKALDKATMADLNSNKQTVYAHKNRMEKAYKKAMRKVKKPVIGAGMLPGS